MPRHTHPKSSSALVSRRMRAVRSTGTAAEVQLSSCLKRMGFRFQVHTSIPGFRCRPDLLFPHKRLAVFVDGCFWHGCPRHGTWPSVNAVWWRDKIEENRARDRRSRAALRRAGWQIVRVWEHEKPERAATRISRLLAVRRSLSIGADDD
jgi:DNA mismatch endonuclease (patch repair protein)